MQSACSEFISTDAPGASLILLAKRLRSVPVGQGRAFPPERLRQRAGSRDTDFALLECVRTVLFSSPRNYIRFAHRAICTCTPLIIINFSAPITFRRISMPISRVERKMSASRLWRLEFCSAALADARFLCKLYCPLRRWSLCILWMPETWCGAWSLAAREDFLLLMKSDILLLTLWLHGELLFKLSPEIITAAWSCDCIVEWQFSGHFLFLCLAGLLSIHFPLTRNFDPILLNDLIRKTINFDMIAIWAKSLRVRSN